MIKRFYALLFTTLILFSCNSNDSITHEVIDIVDDPTPTSELLPMLNGIISTGRKPY